MTGRSYPRRAAIGERGKSKSKLGTVVAFVRLWRTLSSQPYLDQILGIDFEPSALPKSPRLGSIDRRGPVNIGSSSEGRLSGIDFA